MHEFAFLVSFFITYLTSALSTATRAAYGRSNASSVYLGWGDQPVGEDEFGWLGNPSTW